MIGQPTYEAIVLGVSAGGIPLIKDLVTTLPTDFSLPVVIVQHLSDTSNSSWADILNRRSRIRVKEADEKEVIQSGTVYLAPPNYHLMIEMDRTFTLTVDERINYARPSIDVLFETAAEAYGKNLIGIIGSGGNHDGARGLLHINELGGLTIVQEPQTAEVTSMPTSAIEIALPTYVLSPEQIIVHLLNISKKQTLQA